MRTAIRESEMSYLYDSPSSKSGRLRVAMKLIKELYYVGLTCSDQPYDDSVTYLKDWADWELSKTPDTQTDSFKSEVKVDKQLAIEVQTLSMHQILGLLLFNVVVVLQNCDPAAVRNLFPPRPFQSDLLNSALEVCETKKWFSLKELVFTLLGDNKGNVLSFVTLEFARKSASSCYKPVLEMFKLNNRKMKIFRHVLPIKSCRSCRKLDCDLKMCSVCVENDDFPDIHWFCSQECEKKILDGGHLEEHAQDLIKRIQLT